MIFQTVREIASGVRDALHGIARLICDLHKVHQEQIALRATLDQLFLQLQKQNEQSAVGLSALLQAEIETEEERMDREKLEKEFAEFQAVMKQLEEV